jgi:amino acid transporter
MKGRKILVLFRVSLVIAAIIFFTAILSDFSVRMYYSSTNGFVQITSGVIAVIVIAIFIMFLFWWIPDTRNAVLRMFGLDEEPHKNDQKNTPSDDS